MPRSSERSSGLRVALMAGTLALGVNSASAAERLDGFDRVYDRLAAVQEFKSVAISPDGRTGAYVQIRNTGQGAAEGTRLFLVDLDDPASRPRRIRAGATEGADEVAPEFSPDGRSCAFISDGGPGRKADLYIVDVAGGAPRRLTDLKGSLVRPRFSPDGRSLGFLFLEGAEGSGPLGPAPRAVGGVEE